MTTRDYNLEYQDTDARKYAYTFDSIHRRYMIRTFAPFLGQGRALELGSYKGEFTRLLLPFYNDLTVIEASSDLVDEARMSVGGNVRFIHSTFEAAELPETFDAIFLIHTLEHLDDPVRVLRKIGAWLSDAGRLFLVVPNANAPSRQIAVNMGLIPHVTAVTEGEALHGHRKTYTLDTLERDARDSGLRVQQRGGIFFKPLANFQFNALIGGPLIGDRFLDACYELGLERPTECASIYVVAGAQP